MIQSSDVYITQAAPQEIVVSCTKQEINVEEGRVIYREADMYEGEYEATPSSVDQVIPTANKQMSEDFVVKAIPNNYGLITFNGYSITVS